MPNKCNAICQSCKAPCTDSSKHHKHWHSHKWISPSTGDEAECSWWDDTKPS